jgi:cytochrome c oxidase assembly protein subunit 15
MTVSRTFVRFQWITLVLIYLVVVAGSFVRITGSGMGCPDWPKCFGKWVPPTNEKALPHNYQDIFLEKRSTKIKKFCGFLRKIGLEQTALKIESDPTLLVEEPFNAAKTWTEYINRLLGFLAGNVMLIGFVWLLIWYRHPTFILLSAGNLILMGLEGWFGSIVVASNLVPWTITVHLGLALIIIGIQLYMVKIMSPSQQKPVTVTHSMKWLLWIILVITAYQMFLGTQVREYIDELTKQGFGRSAWTDRLGWEFLIHRSFSWLVLILMSIVAWQNERGSKLSIIRWCYIILALELTSGVLLAYADMPGLVQTSHLIFASILLGQLLMIAFRMALDQKAGQVVNTNS